MAQRYTGTSRTISNTSTSLERAILLLGTERSLPFDIRGLVLFQMFQRSKPLGKTKDYRTLQNVARPLHEQFDSNWCSLVVAKLVDPTRKFESLFGVKGWNWNEQKLECGCQRKGNAKFVYDRETCGDWCGNATFPKTPPPQKTRGERRRRIILNTIAFLLRACSRAGLFSLLCLLDLRVIFDVNIILIRSSFSAQKRAKHTYAARIFSFDLSLLYNRPTKSHFGCLLFRTKKKRAKNTINPSLSRRHVVRVRLVCCRQARRRRGPRLDVFALLYFFFFFFFFFSSQRIAAHAPPL